MRLKALLKHVDVLDVQGSNDPQVSHVTRDSRQAGAESLFVAVVGANVDGHQLVADVPSPAVMVERVVPTRPGTVVVRVPSTKLALAQVAAAMEGFPSRQVPVVGVTGTNGKTTTTSIAGSALTALGWRTGRIGTTGNFVGAVEYPTRFTTPEAPEVQRLLAQMRDAGSQAVLMEVTSIGLAQRRVDATEFALGVFTNLTRDHLDFHGTFDAYREAKARLFRELLVPRQEVPALLCGDDPAWSDMGAPAGSLRFGFGGDCEIRVVDLAVERRGMQATLVTPVGRLRLHSPLVGSHNALNLAAAWGIMWCLGVPGREAVDALGTVTGVPGRLERVEDPSGTRLVVVDYAHTDDALAHALAALRPLTRGRLFVVFGCGGDRDVGKRPRMGQVAERGADRVVVTTDNPRSERPRLIIDAIVAGTDRPEAILVCEDRAAAIELALHEAGPGDTVLIAGKGHETYQEVAGVRTPFDDRVVARAAMENA